MQLTEVLNEIIARLLLDDWCRAVSEEGEAYYIVGYKAHVGYEASGERFTGAHFNQTYFPSFTAKESHEIEPAIESHIRSPLAGKQPDYLGRATKRLEQAGVARSAIERFIEKAKAKKLNAKEANPDLGDFHFSDSVSVVDELSLLTSFFQALALAMGASLQPQADQADDVRTAREKLCLKELAGRYGKMVDRWERFEALGTLTDDHLEEASRSYLYGQYRATITLSATALERHLKRIGAIGDYERAPEGCSYYEWLLGRAIKRGLQLEKADAARKVFKRRNAVVHEDWKPKSDDAHSLLGLARMVISEGPGASS